MNSLVSSVVRNKNVQKAVAIGVADAGLELAATTGFLHRDLTHNAFKLKPVPRMISRAIIWGTGIKPRYWAAQHRDHHEDSDTPADPHSPTNYGRWGVAKVIINNARYYRRHNNKKSEADIPEDLKADEWDEKLLDNKKLGMSLNFAGHIAVAAAVTDSPAYGALSWAVSKVGYLAGGGLVNGLGHAGKKPWKALITGRIEPHEDGTVYSDSKTVAAITFGEGNQRWHHLFPRRLRFANPEDPKWKQTLHDPGGAAYEGMVRIRLATVPEEGPQHITPPEPDERKYLQEAA